MKSTICCRCRTALHLQAHPLRSASASITSSRQSSNAASPNDLATLISKPTWSVRSLLPSATSTASTTITPQTLHHLLRLSALPQPSSAEEESQMLSTLESQLGFVRAVREVDTAGVEPLRAIRDETEAGVREQTIGLEQLKEALAKEDVVGHARRPRRRRGGTGKKGESVDPEVEGWDVLAGASETAGRYFVVRTASSGSGQTNISQAGNAKKI
ncbi:hypothetical protein F4818DRAFT_24083 [Hypoxylon cercidicola]|nr:hypothetical protein F4818DRAFT_24083 [Hypoxylon cercidicola]